MSATGKDQQVKATQRAKEEAVHKKKEAIKDKQWAIGAKDTTKSEADSEKTKEKEKRKAEKKAIEANEGGSAVGGGGLQWLRDARNAKWSTMQRVKKDVKTVSICYLEVARPQKRAVERERSKNTRKKERKELRILSTCSTFLT